MGKLTADEQKLGVWGSNEQSLLANVLNYAVQSYTKTTENVNITFGTATERISFCSSIVSYTLATNNQFLIRPVSKNPARHFESRFIITRSQFMVPFPHLMSLS